MKKILVIEDEPNIRELILYNLKTNGYEAVAAEDGIMGITMVHREKPDLILLDGGKGHVNAVAPILRELGLNIPLFGMVKDNKHRTRAIATGGKEIQINGLKAAFNLVTRIQDEVHRYSVSYMHSKHKKKTYASELTTVKGVGEKKAAKLMIAYKTKEKLREATPEQLASVAGVNADVAQELWELIRSM